MNDDPTLKKILNVILEIGSISPIRAMYVCAFMIDCFQSMQDVADHFGKSRRNASKHLNRASIDHPEIARLMSSNVRKEVVRKRGQKRKVKI